MDAKKERVEGQRFEMKQNAKCFRCGNHSKQFQYDKGWDKLICLQCYDNKHDKFPWSNIMGT